jgi:pimeloyl-ACP methyl ester carboxylesterase
MRAVLPTRASHVVRDGVSLGYETFGEGDRTILLLPTWTIIHSRFWKMQVAFLSRHYHVVTYDGPGNGRSDRTTDPDRYTADAYADDAVAVLDACGVEQAVVVGLSLGAQYGTRLAARYPTRVIGLALIGSSLPLVPLPPERAGIPASFLQPYPEDPQGWEKYNLAYWHADHRDFVEFFFGRVFSEPHSTKPIEDAVGWALESGPEILEAESYARELELTGPEIFDPVRCPVMVIHGTEDQIQSHEVGVEAARWSGGTLVSLAGSGHLPNVRDPVKVNLALRQFVEGLKA